MPMRIHLVRLAASIILLFPYQIHAQQPCANGVRVEGAVTDPTGAVIPGASVQTEGTTATADARGHYLLVCAKPNAVITVQAEGFTTGTAHTPRQMTGTAQVNIQLTVAAVQTDVQVNSDSGTDSGGNTTNLSSKAVQQLADDPDDFLRELQVLAGGDPASTIIVVDGFQNTSALPPKNSIASIRINPDIFAPEYKSPLWQGGRIEITTKAGAEKFHGAGFFTDSNGIFNASDPFSTTATPAGRQRYGFELSGPVVPKKIDFALALEKRNIDEFNVVNAVTVDANNNQAPLHEAVAAPQRLWIGSARGDWQVAPKDLATLSFAANVNSLGNQGVGGLVLPEAGYASLVSEYDLHLLNTLTVNPNLLNQSRIGFSWKRTARTPLSTAPSLQVAGYFTGGGATSQSLNNGEHDLEVDDEMMLTHGKHSWKFGAQSLGYFIHDYNPNTFNGAYVFGGGSAPELSGNNQPTGQTITITPIQQYQRALQDLPGGAPTTYQIRSGTPLVSLTQWQLGLYAQDTVALATRLSFSTGLRYQLQTTPNSFEGFDPRVGISWSPDKKETWVIHLRAGLFTGAFGVSTVAEVDLLNGIRQQQATVYSPSYTDPLTPIPGSIRVSTINQFARSIGEAPQLQLDAAVEHDLPHHWHARASYNFGGLWQGLQTVNINAPLVSSGSGISPDPTAALLSPRPIAPNENIVQYQQSGHYRGAVYLASLDQHGYKRFGFHLQYWYLDFKSDPQVPQSSYSEQGESARPDWMRKDGISMFGNATLPYRIELSTQFDASPGQPYNITTGTDVNGDGNFNDRPAYASAPGNGVYSTPFGLLTSNAVNGNVPYNVGTMPGVIHLDVNLSRKFTLNPQDKDHPRTLTFNVRSANLLNHTNVTAVNTVLSSSAIGQPIAAEAARRVESGMRFEF
jgi:hypothetical protein